MSGYQRAPAWRLAWRIPPSPQERESINQISKIFVGEVSRHRKEELTRQTEIPKHELVVIGALGMIAEFNAERRDGISFIGSPNSPAISPGVFRNGDGHLSG